MTMSAFAQTIFQDRYAWDVGTRKETKAESARRMVWHVLDGRPVSTATKRELEEIIVAGKFYPGGRYWANAGRPYHQVNNCTLYRAEDTREGWADLMRKIMMSTMTGAGIGVVYSDLREQGALLKRTGGYSSGPIALMHAVNEAGRAARSGGSRRGAIWAGLHWNHPDVLEFIALKDWTDDIRAAKAKNFSHPAPMDHTNISVILDDNFFVAYALGDFTARTVYWNVVRRMCETGEPGLSIDTGPNTGENLRNACTELTSRDDSDICNLGSINLAAIDGITDMHRVVELGTMFLLGGTMYSDLPHPEIIKVREKNRRLGLGLMGVHEFVARAGGKYGDDRGISAYLNAYTSSTEYAKSYADDWNISRPVKTRAIAPTGTIGQIAETTTGIEPIFCAAFRRRYFDHGTWRAQFVIDPTARKLVAEGVRPDDVEDAYSITPDRRVGFQAFVQTYVDHGISSTINLPTWGSEKNNELTIEPFGEMLLAHLPNLRGITAYPDGSRSGQPLEKCDFAEALKHEGEVFTENATESVDVCDLRGGSCGA